MLKTIGKAIVLIIILGIVSAITVPRLSDQPRSAAPASGATPRSTISPEAITPSMRQDYANRLEQNYLNNGMDVYVQVRGKRKDSISIKYVLLSRPAVYKIQQDGKLLEEMRQLGFKKAVFADGMDTTYTFNLAE